MKIYSPRPSTSSPAWWLAIGLVAVVLVVFGRAVRFEFLNWDDLQQVVENPNVKSPSLAGVAASWREPYWRLYIPVSYTFLAAEAALAQNVDPESGVSTLRPSVFHFGNLLLHAGCTLLVFVILRRLLWYCRRAVDDQFDRADRIDYAAALGALLFAVHPLQIESVAWISEVRGLLCALFGLLALWQYIEYAEANERGATRWAWYGGACATFILALLSKPAAVALPFMAAVVGFGILRRRPLTVLLEISPWLAAAIGVALVTKHLQPDSHLNSTVRLAARPLIALDSISFYLGKLLLPLPLSADYSRTPSFVLHSRSFQIGWIVLPVAIAALVWFRPRRVPLVSFLLFSFWLAPVLGLVAFDFQRISTVADRFVYLGMLGPALLAAWLIARFWDRNVAAVATAACALLAVISFSQLGAWRSTGDLFAHAWNVNPHGAVAPYHLGRLAMLEGNSAEAIRWYQKSIENGPGNMETHLDLAKTLFLSDQVEAAREVLHNAPVVTPADKQAVEDALKAFASKHSSTSEVAAEINAGHAEEVAGHFAEARKHYLVALAIQPRNYTAHYNLGNIASAERHWAEAIDRYREALKINAEYAPAYVNFCNALLQAGEIDEARVQGRAATIADPNLIPAHMMYGQALLHSGSSAAAATEFRRALDLAPANSPQRAMIQRMIDMAQQPQ